MKQLKLLHSQAKTAKTNPTGIYLLNVNNRRTRARCKICSKLTIKIPERHHCFSVSIVNFEHVIAGWETSSKTAIFYNSF